MQSTPITAGQKTKMPKTGSRRAAMRTKLIQTTIELTYRKGFEALSVQEIADHAGISVGGLYRHISTKSDLLVMACEDIFDGLKEEMIDAIQNEPSISEKLRKAMHAYGNTCFERADTIRVTYREFLSLPHEARARFKEQENEIAQVLQDIIRAGIYANVFVAVDDRIIALEIMFLAHMSSLKNWALHGYDISTIIDEHAKLFLSRLCIPKPLDLAK